MMTSEGETEEPYMELLRAHRFDSVADLDLALFDY